LEGDGLPAKVAIFDFASKFEIEFVVDAATAALPGIDGGGDE
jgi:hypothetical protein